MADICERQINIKMNRGYSMNWFIDLSAAFSAGLPFRDISSVVANCQFRGINYLVRTEVGSFPQPGGDVVFRISSENDY